MIKVLSLAVGLCLTAVATEAVAQVATPPAATLSVSRGPVGNPFAGLRLTEAQRTKLRALTEETRAASAAILARYSAGRRPSTEDRAALARLAEHHAEGVRAVLTDRQKTALESNLRAIRAEHARRASVASIAHGAPQ